MDSRARIALMQQANRLFPAPPVAVYHRYTFAGCLAPRRAAFTDGDEALTGA